MEHIAVDVETLHLGIGDLDAFLIDRGVENGVDFESGLGRRRRNQIDDRGMVRQWPAAPVLRDVTEQAMLDFVPFRGPRRVMSDLDGEIGFRRQASGARASKAAHVRHWSRRNLP